MTVRRLLSTQSYQRTTTLPLLTACTGCKRQWLEAVATPKCVWCNEAARTMTIAVGPLVVPFNQVVPDGAYQAPLAQAGTEKPVGPD